MNTSINTTILSNTSETFDMRRVDFTQLVIYFLVEFLLLIAKVYILAALSYFVRKRKNSDDHHEPSRKGKHLIALLMLATIFIILQSSYFLQFLFYPNHSPTSSFHCFLVESIGNVLSVAGFTSIFLFLWYRQHTLYALPCMETQVPRSLKRFSDSLLVIMLLAAIGVSVGLVAADPGRFVYIPQTQTCTFPETTDNVHGWAVLAAYVVILFFQASLLFCFVYILRRHQADIKQLQQSNSNSLTTKSSRSLQKLIRNCVIATAITMISDITCLGLFFLLRKPQTLLYNGMIFDMDFIINLMCGFACFSAWKEMIDPWLIRKKIKRVLCFWKRRNNLGISTTSSPSSNQ